MNSIAYNKYTILTDLPYNVVTHLFTNDKAEIIWKLLKYNDSDAWMKPDLTQDEKAALVYNGELNDAGYCIFRDQSSDDGQDTQKTFLRIFVNGVIPSGRTVGIANISFEVLSHSKITHLSNYQQRVDVIIKTLLDIFNGEYIGGLGQFFFNADKSSADMIKTISKKYYKGKELIMSLNV